MSMLHRLILLGVCFVLLAPQFGRPQQSRWENLLQLKPGQHLKVTDHHHKSLSGQFVRSSNSDVTILANSQERKIGRNEVSRIEIKVSTRKRHALIGAAIGAGFGTAAGSGYVGEVNDSGAAKAGFVVFSAAIFGAIGAGVGAVMPVRTKWIIYDAGKPETASATPPAVEASASPGS